jgi:hypothetical protein
MKDTLGSYRTDGAFTYRVGGLVGVNTGSITNSYAKGQVLVSDRRLTFNGITKPIIYGGGLVGFDASASGIISSYWINAIAPTAGTGWSAVNQPVGQGSSFGAQLSSALTRSSTQAGLAQSFSDWDLSSRWLLYEEHGTPYLRTFMTPLYVQVSNPMEKIYDGGRSIDTSASTLPQGLSKNLWGNLVGLLAEKNAGVQKVYAAGLYSDQAGYQVRYEYQQPTVLVKKAPLRVFGVKAMDKAYDGASYAVLDVSALQLDGLISGDDISVKFSGNFVSNDEGPGKQVLLDAQIAGIDLRNYDVVRQTDASANITKPVQSYLANPTNTVKGNSPLAEPKPGHAVVNPVPAPQQESAPREVYDKFDKYLAVQPQNPAQAEVYDKFDKYLAVQPQKPAQAEVYDKFDKYLVAQAQSNVQALRDSSLKVAGEVPGTHKQAEREGVRTDAVSYANTAKTSQLEDDADTKTQDPRIGSGIEAQEKKSAGNRKAKPVTLNTSCSPSPQDRGASVRITCQASDVGGKR